MQRFILLLAAVWLGFAGAASAQLRGVRADVTPVVEGDGVRAGTEARVALQVALPDGFHVQSNKPRDPNLIPTELQVTRRTV